jgi:hypothetical protein
MLLLGGLACSGSGPAREPSWVPLASSKEAQEQFRPLQKSWATGSREQRLLLEPKLLVFQKRFGDDELSRAADALIGWARLERGDLQGAAEFARRAQARGPGSTADIGIMIEGAILRRRGQPEAALAKLSPLSGKLIDNHARAFLNEEAVQCALAARRFPMALDLMHTWLREAADDERDRARSQIEQLLSNVPTPELVAILNKAHPPEQAEPGKNQVEIDRLVAQRLAADALARRDVGLARRLLGDSGSLLGSRGDEVADLAAGAGVPRVEAPTLGLLISLRTDETRRRGIEVAAGLTHGIGLPGSMARLVSRDDGGRAEQVEEALRNLSADGAAILIGGIDETEATIAARFADRSEIPLVLLHPPDAQTKPSNFVFILGEDPLRIRAALVAAVKVKGGGRVAVVVDQVAPTTDPSVEIHACRALPPTWKGFVGVVIEGGCTREALEASAQLRGHQVLGLDLGGLRPPPGILVATAGAYPIDAATTIDSLRAWHKSRSALPGWWAGLGHDAGVLAWSGVQVLPAQGTKDPREVKARWTAAATSLAHVQANLWTTDARGFGGGRRLPRQIGVREVK